MFKVSKKLAELVFYICEFYTSTMIITFLSNNEVVLVITKCLIMKVVAYQDLGTPQVLQTNFIMVWQQIRFLLFFSSFYHEENLLHLNWIFPLAYFQNAQINDIMILKYTMIDYGAHGQILTVFIATILRNQSTCILLFYSPFTCSLWLWQKIL